MNWDILLGACIMLFGVLSGYGISQAATNPISKEN